jgi:hypothetical protein
MKGIGQFAVYDLRVTIGALKRRLIADHQSSIINQK